jgi:uncharacterized membrane protein
MNKKIFFVFLFAFLIRLIALNQSLWLDEAVTANVIRHFNLTQIISKFSPTDFHPPLYYLFMKLWTNLFGFSEIALRMPSVLFSLMTGYVVFLIGGIWAAVFFLFNPLIVYYSQEARMYMMTTFFLTSALYFFISNKKNQIFFTLFISLAFLTFYGSIFLIAPMLLYFLYKKQYKVFILNTLYFTLVALLISPLLYQQLVNSKITMSGVTNWSLVLGKANIKNLLLIPIKFSIGRISFYPKWLYWGIAGIWTGFVLFSIKTVLNKTVFIKTVFYLFIFPLFLGFLVSFFTPMLQYFRFIYLIPIVSILLATGKKTSMYRYIEVFGFVVFSLVYLLLPQFHREDWKSLVKSLPKDKPVYMIMASSDPVKYYSSNLRVKELTLLRQGFLLRQDYGGQVGGQGESLENEITVIPFSAGVYGLDYKSFLTESGYQLKKEVSFREVTLEQWSLLK